MTLEPLTESSAESALARLSRSPRGERPRVVFLVLGEAEAGIATGVLRRLGEVPGTPPIVVVLEAAEPRVIQELLDLGAADFLTPPLTAAQVLPRVGRLVESAGESVRLKRRLKEGFGLRRLVGEDREFRRQVELARRIARWDVSVLIYGETGTGKELFGRAIHYLSPRSGGPFISINCGAMPVDLVENELFGHRRAAFTGASSSEIGLVKVADGGTLVLDEVDTLPPTVQVKLLRFLQDREFRPLGSPRVERVDVRIIAATNSNPEKAVERGQLRRDLYYRLNVVRLEIPPLRERGADAILLARHFLDLYRRQYDRPACDFAPGALEDLLLHSWPGNVRELQHAVERALLVSDDERLLHRGDLDLPARRAGDAPTTFRAAKARTVAEFERRYVKSLLTAHAGNVSRAARAAQKDRKSFWRLMRKHGIEASTFRH